jgi:acetamidase/formamidase
MRNLVVCLALLAPAFAAEHRVIAESYYHTFSRTNPVLARVAPGDTVITKTVDSAGFDFKGVRRTKTHGNPLTGPFYVKGAEPGDALVVRLNRVRLNRNSGHTGYRLGTGAVLPSYVESMYPDKYKEGAVLPGRTDLVPWEIDLEQNKVRPREALSPKHRLEFEARPMLGCIGVTPAGDFTPTSGPAGPWGGNMDFNEVAEGATVMLPVFQPGGLFYLGDGHALQGDGEPIGSGVETSLDVEFTIDLRKRAGLTGPRLETGEYLVSIGAQPEFSSPLDHALQMATTDMVDWLTKDYGLDPVAAHMIIGYQARYVVVTVAGTMALKIPKRVLR